MTDERTLIETDINTLVEFGIKKNVILDSQVLTALMSCPRLTDFRFNHNFVSIGGKSNSLECGSIVHTFLEHFYKNMIGGMKRDMAIGHAFTSAELYISGCKYCTDFTPIELPCTICYGGLSPLVTKNCEECKGTGITTKSKPSCGHKVNDYPGLKNTPKETDSSNPREKYKTGWAWVLDTCQQYVDFYRNDHWIPLEVEIVKGEILYEDSEVRILWKAKLDLVSDTNQGIYPIDHKTMKQRRDTNSMNNQFIGQCLLMKTRNVIINKIGFQTSLKPEEKFIRVPISYSAARLIEWQSEILPYYAKLLLMYAETGHFPPNFTNCESKYGNCAFLKVCESDPSMREEEIKSLFMIGPDWNPTNEIDETD